MFGTVDFSNKYIVLSGTVPPSLALAKAKEVAVVWGYGNFITIAINFLIIAFALFLVVKGINRLRRQEAAEPAPAPAPEEPADVKLLTEIRDLLKKP
jgi:large conductance mechanosensitive channel